VVHEGDDGVGAGVDRRGGSAVVGEAQVAQLDGGVAFRGGRRPPRQKKGTGLVATVPCEKSDGRNQIRLRSRVIKVLGWGRDE
jgi:hypothetical protein